MNFLKMEQFFGMKRGEATLAKINMKERSLCGHKQELRAANAANTYGGTGAISRVLERVRICRGRARVFHPAAHCCCVIAILCPAASEQRVEHRGSQRFLV